MDGRGAAQPLVNAAGAQRAAEGGGGRAAPKSSGEEHVWGGRGKVPMYPARALHIKALY